MYLPTDFVQVVGQPSSQSVRRSVDKQHTYTHTTMFLTIRNLAAALLLLLSGTPASAFTNPIRQPGGSDPHVSYSDGYYYLMTTTWTDVQIARSATVEGLKTAEKKVVYATDEANRCCNVWAPEVHYLDGAWYVYYTAGNADDLEGQNLHVLQGAWFAFTFTFYFSCFVLLCVTFPEYAGLGGREGGIDGGGEVLIE